MSAQITQIDGLIITQFYGGKRGLCLQFDTRAAYETVLTKKQVQELVKELQNWLGETELPWKTDERDWSITEFDY